MRPPLLREQFAVDLPNFGQFADPRLVMEIAWEAEETGWDGFSL